MKEETKAYLVRQHLKKWLEENKNSEFIEKLQEASYRVINVKI